MEFGVPIKVNHNSSRGYYLLVPSSLNPLPPGFTQAVLNKKSIGGSSSSENDTLFSVVVVAEVVLLSSSSCCSSRNMLAKWW